MALPAGHCRPQQTLSALWGTLTINTNMAALQGTGPVTQRCCHEGADSTMTRASSLSSGLSGPARPCPQMLGLRSETTGWGTEGQDQKMTDSLAWLRSATVARWLWSVSMLIEVYNLDKGPALWDVTWVAGVVVAVAMQAHIVVMVCGADTHAPISASLKTYNEDSHASCWGCVGIGRVCPACPQLSGPYSCLD